MKHSISSLPATLLTLTFLAGGARADLAAWVNAVNAGTQPSYTNTSVTIPSMVHIGIISSAQGITYEFVVNATNDGLSSALMGARNTGTGTNSAFKFEQYADTGNFGITLWGVSDWSIAPNITNQDVHVVFVVDSSTGSTDTYVDGAFVGMTPNAPHLTNQVGLGQWFDPNGSNDIMTGAMHGVAVYEGLMPAAEVLEHALAYHGTEPGTSYCFGTGCPCGNDDAQAGCANSNGAGGLLISSGTTNVGVDDLAFEATGLLPGQPALLFSADNAVGGGNGVIFGDGLRCAGGNLVRLGVSTPSAQGVANWGPGLASSGGWSSGQTRRFQGWYRDSVGGPCAGGFNLTQGVEVTFTP